MQRLGAYSFYAKLNEEELNKRFLEIKIKIKQWLLDKGVENTDKRNGEFKSKTGDGIGNYYIEAFDNLKGKIFEANLREKTNNNKIFYTKISLVQNEEKIIVYSSLAVSSDDNVISPFSIYPKCPLIIRDIIGLYSDWYFSEDNLINTEKKLIDEKIDVLEICQKIKSPNRGLPIILVSVDEDELIWPNLAEDIAKDLVGIASVYAITSEASWDLTDELGKKNSCYLGATKIYWPLFKGDNSINTKTWTSGFFDEINKNGNGLKKFLSIIRNLVMSTAALTIGSPKSLNDIRRFELHEQIKNLEKNVLENKLNEFAEENSELNTQCNSLHTENAALRLKIAQLEDEIYELKYESKEKKENDDIENKEISKGDIIFYKKIGNRGGGVDTLVRFKDCPHNNWKPAHSGDQAEKGIAKLEGRNDWQSIWHCPSCTGGGRWKIIW